MRDDVRSGFVRGLALAFLLPATLAAQGTGTTQQTGTRQRVECRVGDGTRGFTRALGDTSRSGATGGAGRVTGGTARSQQYPEFDVVLDIPNLCVERIHLKVDSVTAKLALNAQVANLLRVNAGADVLIGKVDLTVQGVRARALLLVDLDDVVYAVDQTLTFVDNHPEVANQLTSTIANTGAAVGGLVGGVLRGLLLGTSRNSLGQTVQRLVNETSGAILERTLSAAGQVLQERTVGAVTSLPTIRETTNTAGQLVRQVRDQTGTLIKYTLDRATQRISGLRLVR